MMDIKTIKATLEQLELERGIPKEKIIDAIEQAIAAAYKKDYGKRGQIVRAHLNMDTGQAEVYQVKTAVDPEKVRMPDEEKETDERAETETPKTRARKTAEKEKAEEKENIDEEEIIRFNPEHHILLDEARKIKKGVSAGDEIVFPLEAKDDYGRIAAQTAKQVIIQRIREAERESVLRDFGDKKGEIASGTVQRIERGNIFVDLGRAIGFLPFNEQISSEHYRQGEQIRSYLSLVEDTPRGITLKLSRIHPKFIEALFALEVPEIASGVVEIKAIAREAGSRSKIAVFSHDSHIDPVGACVGPKGVRVSTVISELHGEKIDIIEWSEDTATFIARALSPATVTDVAIVNETLRQAKATVHEDELSLAIGKGGQNVRLAAKLTGWKLDIRSIGGSGEIISEAEANEKSDETEINGNAEEKKETE
ncbi:MAG: transcription termination/antitermination protein NusA [Parcubacteria group bacterium]|nr:transcription termination/antitermination protein NusA [Parcubacteria group bacterium]